MPEYGPFIEYCCELYIHHDIVNAIVAAVMCLSVLLVLGTALLTHHLTKHHT